MMKKFLLGLLASGAVQAASASVITVEGAFTATDWQVYFGTPSAPVDPLYLQYSVTFDDALTYDSAAGVVSVVSTNIPYSFDFSYEAGSGTFILASFGGPNICTHFAPSFCAFVSDFSTGVASFVEQSPATGGGWRAQTITAGVAAVPEPPTWALLGAIGLAAAVVRRRRTPAA